MARQKNHRRDFLKGLFAGVTVVTFPGAAFTYAANDKLNMACIGAGGQATGGINTALGQSLLAVAEVDQKGKGKQSLDKVGKEAPGAKLYTDYRKLFDEHKGKIQKEKCIGVRGRISNRNGEYSIVADALKELV